MDKLNRYTNKLAVMLVNNELIKSCYTYEELIVIMQKIKMTTVK